MHTMNEQACAECGDLDGCHLRSRLARFRDAVAEYRDGTKPYGRVLPRVVCLCGSTRFFEEFQRANYRETTAGNVVLSVGFYPHSPEAAHGEKVGCDDEQKKALDALHLHKIDLADEILVLNVGGYVGDSTRREIDHARRTGKPVRFLEPHPVAGLDPRPDEQE